MCEGGGGWVGGELRFLHRSGQEENQLQDKKNGKDKQSNIIFLFPFDNKDVI